MANPLFSTYRQGENRVTASFLAVLKRLSFPLVERILQALCEEPEKALLTFTNQPRGTHLSRPDARIGASFAYWIETKTAPNSVSLIQLQNHLQALAKEEPPVERQRLLVLTPDAREPPSIAQLNDKRLAWTNFDNLMNILRDVLAPPQDWLIADTALATEQERGLLREFANLVLADGLIGTAEDRVLVVAARTALLEYLDYRVYMCQPNRAFQPSAFLGFYAGGQIYSVLPRIRGQVESVVLSAEGIAAAVDLDANKRKELDQLLSKLLQANSDRIGTSSKVLLLTSPEDKASLRLPYPVTNDLVSESGRTIAFTQGQRYVPLPALKKAPRTTRELVALMS